MNTINVQRDCSTKHLKRLLAEVTCEPVPDIADCFPAVVAPRAYRLFDGRVVVLFNIRGGGGLLYTSEAAFLEEMRGVVELMSRGPRHALAGLLPYGEDFPAHIDELIAKLPAKLKIRPTDLDFRMDSLAKLDRAVKRTGYDRCLEPDLLAPLMAYVGETARRAARGRWHMEPAGDGMTWEPWIIDDRGERRNVWLRLYDEIAEQRAEGSIAGAVPVAIGYRGG